MNLDYRFRLLVFGQVLLGIVAFCLAEANPGLMLLAGSLGAASWYFAEGPRARPLPRWVVNAGSLVAMGIMLAEVVRQQGGLIVAMGHFTMTLQLLMLYSRKENREYSMLLVLSLIQMIGASVLSVSVIYGLLLTAYCGLALVTVLLFQIKATADGVHQRRTRAAAAAGYAGLPRRPPMVGGQGLRWHLRGAWVVIGVLSAMLAAMIFIALPRSGDMPMLGVQANRQAGPRRIGFSPTVSLSETAPQTGSSDAVMNMAVRKFGENYGNDHTEFLLRGAALDRYDPSTQQWRRGALVSRHEIRRTFENGHLSLAELPHPYADLEATITLRAPSPQVLFVPAEPQMTGGAVGHLASTHLEQVSFNPIDQQITGGEPTASAIIYTVRVAGLPAPQLVEQYAAMEEAARAANFEFNAFGFDRPWGRRREPLGWGWRAIESLPGLDRYEVRRMRRSWRAQQAALGFDRNERVAFDAETAAQHVSETYARGWPVESARIRALTLEVLAESGLSRDPLALHAPEDARIATVLADYLRTNFQYSLNNPRPRPGEDAIVEFLFEHQQGHCELFASALAAMCRSINIPARVVTGYRASEYNTLGGYYVVRHNHAHAWAEVNAGPTIGWRTLDATPPSEVSAEHAGDTPGWLAATRQLYEYLEFTWVRSVVAYDERTRQSVLSSMNRKITSALSAEPEWLINLWTRVGLWSPKSGLRWAGWALLMAGATLMLGTTTSLLAATWRRRRLRRKLGLDTMAPEFAKPMTRRLRFYLDYTELLERHGYHRPAWQTPAVYADALHRERPETFAHAVALTDHFYDVRFGEVEIDHDRRQAINSHLRALEAALTQPRTS